MPLPTIGETLQRSPIALKTVLRGTTAAAILVCLIVLPAPLLPSSRMADAVQSASNLTWEGAYFVSAILVQAAFYITVGLLATFVLNRAATLRGRLLQIAILPLGLVGFGMIIRILRAGHLPVLPNIVVPIAACLLGVSLGFVFLYRSWKIAMAFAATCVAVGLWGFVGGTSSGLRAATLERLQRIVTAGPQIPSGEARFGKILEIVFSPATGKNTSSAIEQNRAAILALGIAVGHPRIANLVGLEDRKLVEQAAAAAQGATLNGREDWPMHYALSAALAVLKHSFVSDAGGLVKEEMDALGRGSGFSFGDLAADRAGVRFANAATYSEASATAMQFRILNDFSAADFFPAVLHFPENLTVQEFQREYQSVGSERYRAEQQQIEKELDACAALTVP